MWLWIRYILAFFLLPLVLILGRRIRKTILRLPEAPGKRNGALGKDPIDLHVASLGESPIGGVGLSHQNENLTPILAQHIHRFTQKSVAWSILGKTGIRLSALLPTFAASFPSKIDIIFVGMGVNDCKEGTTMLQWKKEWLQLHTHLRQRYPKALLIYSSTPPLLSFSILPLPIRVFLGYRSDVMNDSLRRIVLKLDKNTMYLPLPHILEAKYFAKDGFHPNAEAHKEWAQAIFDAIVDHKYLSCI